MANLTESAYYVRQGLKVTFLVFLGLIFLRIVMLGIGSVWQRNYRPPAPPPDVAFGKLPSLIFPSEGQPTEPVTYTQEFVGGILPESSISATVYFTPQPLPNFLSLERAKDFALQLGFKNEPEAQSQTLYKWVDGELPLRTLQKDIIEGNFSLAYDFYKDPTVLEEKDIAYGKRAVTETLAYLDRYNISSVDLDENEAKVSFWKSTGSQLLPVASASEAEIVRIDLFRSQVAGLSVVTPSHKEALVYFLLSGSRDKRRVLFLHYTLRPIEQGYFATYPLKTTQEAWADLEAGKGYVASWGEVRGTHVTIQRVRLAYFESETYQAYLQPVFVFEGEGGFAAYVSAIAKDWVGEASGGSQKPS